MSNVEHPKHYQLSIDVEPLDLIAIVLKKIKLTYLDAFLVGSVIECLFKADKNNKIEYYKIALYYSEKIFKIKDDKIKYTYTESMFKEKIIRAFKNKKIQIIIRHIMNLDFYATEEVLKKYIEEQEKQNEI